MTSDDFFKKFKKTKDDIYVKFIEGSTFVEDVEWQSKIKNEEWLVND
jgi:hypothetical protein